MARFKRSGKNWEGRSFTTAKSLNALMDEIELWQPSPRPADGTVASKTHDQNNPSSDHRPRPFSGSGIVHAVDVGELNEDGSVLAEAVRAKRDPRLKYLIHEGRLFSSYNHVNGAAWTWRPYSGYNAHSNHVHISVYRSSENNGAKWNLGLQSQEGDEVELVKQIQTALNKTSLSPKLVVDGIWGPKTEAAFLFGLNLGPASSAVDNVARANATSAHTRLNKLHAV